MATPLQLQPRPSQVRCPGCLQDLGGTAAIRCDGCGATYHRGCWLALASACGTLGCRHHGARAWARRRARRESQRRVRTCARIEDARAWRARRRWLPWQLGSWLAVAPLVSLGLLGGLGSGAGLVLGFTPPLLLLWARRRWGPRRRAPLPPAAAGLGRFQAASGPPRVGVVPLTGPVD